METKRLNIRIVDDSSNIASVVRESMASVQPFILGVDMVIAARSSETYIELDPPAPPAAGALVRATRNCHTHDVLNGDLGIVTEHDGDLVVEIATGRVSELDGRAIIDPEQSHFLPLSDLFTGVGAMSYQDVQGHRFRSVVAAASGQDDCYLRVLARIAQDVTLVGTPRDLATMIGTLGDDGTPDLAEVSRRLFVGTGTEWEISLDGTLLETSNELMPMRA